MVTAIMTIQRLKIKTDIAKKVLTNLAQKATKCVMIFINKAMPWAAALLIVIGFTVWGTEDERLSVTIALLIGKLALIVMGVILLVLGEEKET